MKRSDKLALAILVAFITVLFSDVLVLGRNFYFRDLTRYYYPTKKLVRDTILAGEFPSWNSMYAGGQPMAANPDYEVFYPPQWLTLLPGYDFGYRLHILFHIYLAAVGMYLLLRHRQLGLHASMFGAIAFSCGGLLLSSINLLPILFCLAWLPAVMLAFDRRFEVAALLLAMVFLAGEPVTIAQVSLLLFVQHHRSWRRFLAIHAAAFVVASVQLIPALDHFRDSVRARGFTFDLVSTWSTPPLKLAELVVPQVMGAAAEHCRFYWGTAQYNWLDPFFISIYFGLVAIALAAGGLVARLRGSRLVIVALVVSTVLALGDSTPLLRALYDARLFSSFRFPEKFLILGVFPLTLFAAHAFDAAVAGNRRVVRVATGVAAVAAVLSGLLLVASTTARYADAFASFWQVTIHPLALQMAEVSRGVWLAALLTSLATVAALLLPQRLFATFVVALLAADLGWQRFSVAETIEGRFFRERPQLARTIPPGARVFHQADWYGASRIARSYFDLPEMYWVIRNGVFPLTGTPWGIPTVLNRDVDQTFLQPTADLVAEMGSIRSRVGPSWHETVMTMAAAQYRAVYLPLQRPADPRAIQPVIFLPARSANPKFHFTDGSGQVTSVRETSNSARLEVRAERDAVLICTITRHKYWRATVDGRETAIGPANIAFQAVRVPAGAHVVELRYRNPLLLGFGIVSLAAFAALLAMMLSRDRAELRPR